MSRKRKRPPANATSGSPPETLLAEGSGGVPAELEPILEVADDLERRQDEREAAEDAAELDAAAGEAAAPDAVTDAVTEDAGASDAAEPGELDEAMFADATIAELDGHETIAGATIDGLGGDAVDAATEAGPDAARADTVPAPGDGGPGVEAADGEAGELADDAELDAPGAAALPTSAAALPPEQLKLLVEALVFASDKPMTVARLRQLTRVSDTRRLEQALADLQNDHRERGIVLQQVSGGWQFRTATPWATWVQQLIAGRPVRLTRAQLETLAIVAYRQPITRPELDDIRGVDSSATLKLLMDRGLIRALGRKEEVGRPTLFGTTKEFLDFFSLGDLRELPTLREYSELTDESRRVVDDKLGAARSDAALDDTSPAVAPAEPSADALDETNSAIEHVDLDAATELGGAASETQLDGGAGLEDADPRLSTTAAIDAAFDALADPGELGEPGPQD